MLASYEDLVNMTGKTYRTIKKKIKGLDHVKKKGNRLFFNSTYALPLIYGGESRLDLQQERARLTKKQTEKTEIQIDQLKNELVPADIVAEGWAKLVGAMRAKLLAIPVKAAPLVLAAADQEEVRAVLKKQVHDSLSELHTELSTVVDKRLTGSN
ncbi:hypothetical protein KAR10_06275 [bacterium]|nr:hypothetical protein [bacterium]